MRRSNMIDRLTDEQQVALVAYRDEVFGQATSTEAANRPRAEAAARRLAELMGVRVDRVRWVLSPADGAAAYRARWSSLSASLHASLRDSLISSLSDSFRASRLDSLIFSLISSLSASLSASLRASLSDSLISSLNASLCPSLWASLRDSGWVAYYAFPAAIGLVQYAPDAAEKLALMQEMQATCFALWLVPGEEIILCERPATVDIRDGRLVGLTWRTTAVKPAEEE